MVSAGTINSPQLLELSGIGQPERLRDLGIEVRHALPGVGENLRDHYAPRTRWAIGAKGITYNDTARGSAWCGRRCAMRCSRDGLLGMRRGADPRFRPLARRPRARRTCLLGWVPMLTEPGPKGPMISRQSGMTCYAHPMRPESKGHIHITVRRSTPAAGDQLQLSVVADRCRDHRARGAHRALGHDRAGDGASAVTEIAPGASQTTDDEILDWVKRAAETTYHPVGTCKMGADPMAVVDARLRVHGIAGLRVADASIMPTLTSGNTNAPSIMIGEKAADMMLQDATA